MNNAPQKRPVRFFNITGPCNPWDHYMLPPEDRLVGAQLHRYIGNKLYMKKAWSKCNRLLRRILVMRHIMFIIIVLSFLAVLPAQEALKSVEEEYYDFLALQGLTERPTLNYRTLSDSIWAIEENASHPWQDQNLGAFYPLFGDIQARVYGPELFMSYNTAAPYGQNDGVLWQGRGFNTSLKGGARLEGYGLELTILPHFAFSQNLAFDIMPSAYESEYGYFWGYGNNKGVDAPQRFGDKAFFDWDFGDSEIRYTWKTLTVGFGTQAIWLGSAYLNPILHSNNAPAYPKFDIGLRKQSVTIPWLNWYAGDIEARIWTGQLSESDYFDSDASNDHTMIHGLSLAYAPSFLPGLTLFANRVCLVPWEWENLNYIIPIWGNTIEDQKASFGFSWLFPQVGFEVFGEMGIDDFVGGGILGDIRHPFHTTVYTGGLKKAVNIKPDKNVYGEIIIEFNWMEMTQDYQPGGSYTFYMHHQLIHGYTNRGQWLGNGSSPGGNSQYLAFKLYYPQGTSTAIIGRNNPDNNYLYSRSGYFAHNGENPKKTNLANFFTGINTSYFLNSNFLLSGGIVYDLIINPLYQRAESDNTYLHNFSFQLGIKILL